MTTKAPWLWAMGRMILIGPIARPILLSAERRELVETFFDAHWHYQIYPYPRYRVLLEQRVQGQRFSIQDLTDLKMWFNLTWFPHELRTGTVTLSDGTTVSVQRFVEQGAKFTQRDIEAMLGEQDKILRHILPLHRQLQERGQIEVSVTPYGHPILPLLMDTGLATLDRSGATLPARFAHPEDAEAHVAMAITFYREWFGREPRGMWPAEGAVAEAITPLFARHGLQWIATDEGVLARSGRYGYRGEDPNALCQPYQVLNPEWDGELSILFRNRQLSDAIGFRYQALPDPEQAAQSFIAAVKELARGLQGERDFLVSVILDGENAWGSYRDDGRPFLHALYGALADVEPPAGLDRHIVPHRAIWTCTAPLREIQVGDELIVRTNCPGTLTWSLDAWQRLTESPLSPVGGVMAGACRYAVTLGPFPAGTTLAFRFRCQHPGCTGETACCRGQEWTVQVLASA